MRKAASQKYSYVKAVFVLLIVALFVSINVPVVASATAISAKSLSGYSCDSTEWHFVITQVDSESLSPAQIQVNWADGGNESVPLDKYTGKTAHYTTTAHLTSAVTSATTSIYNGWSGQFNLSHGPCGASSQTPAPTVSATASPTATPVVTASPTATPVVTAMPTATPVATVTSSSTVSNGLSDNLGCSVHDCSGNVVPHGGVVLGVATELPSTGGYNVMAVVYAFATFVSGIALIKHARSLEHK